MMDKIFIFVGVLATSWVVFGFLWVLFGMEIKMAPAPYHPPLHVKLLGVLTASLYVPWGLLSVGSLPKGMAMAKDTMSREDIQKWLADTCTCDSCRKRRGEL